MLLLTTDRRSSKRTIRSYCCRFSSANCQTPWLASAGMTVDEALTRVVEIEKQIAALQAEQARLVTRIVDDPCAGAPAPMLDKHYLEVELRASLGESAVTCNHRIHLARTLVHRLPATLGAMAAGEVTQRHANALVNALDHVDPDDRDRAAVQLEAACVPFAATHDYPAFTRKIRRELAALPVTLADHQRRARERQTVWSSADPDGLTATVGAVLSAAGARTLMTAVDTAADLDRADAPDQRTTLDQRRADGLVRIAADWLDSLMNAGRLSTRLQLPAACAVATAPTSRSPSPCPPCSASTTSPATSQATARSRRSRPPARRRPQWHVAPPGHRRCRPADRLRPQPLHTAHPAARIRRRPRSRMPIPRLPPPRPLLRRRSSPAVGRGRGDEPRQSHLPVLAASPPQARHHLDHRAPPGRLAALDEPQRTRARRRTRDLSGRPHPRKCRFERHFDGAAQGRVRPPAPRLRSWVKRSRRCPTTSR